MQKIIVPTDFSETSSSAIRFATFLAEVMDTDLMVVHVFDPNISLTHAVSQEALATEKERLKEKLSAFVEKHAFPVLSTFQGNMATLPSISTEVLEGFPSMVIRELTNRLDVAFMVMGGVGSGSVTSPPDIFGRVARGVALHGQCPVILIPTAYGYPTVEHLALAFKDLADIPQMKDVTYRLLQALRPRVSFVHVNQSASTKNLSDDPTLLEKELDPDFSNYSPDYSVISGGSTVKTLLGYVAEAKVDLLVLGGKRRTFWEGLFADSALRPLVNRCEVPLLVIPLPAKAGKK